MTDFLLWLIFLALVSISWGAIDIALSLRKATNGK